MEVKGYKQTNVGLIPKDWKVELLNNISDKITVGIASAATHAYRKRGVVLLRNQNIKNNFLDDRDLLYISSEYEQLFKKKRLKTGDLLTARTGYPGITCIVPEKYEHAQSFTTLITRPNNTYIESEFLCYYLNSAQGQAFFDTNQIGGGQKNVNAGTLKMMPIPLPTKEEQTAIATALSDTDALISSLEKLIAKKRAIKLGAMQEMFKPKKGWRVKNLGDCLLRNPDYGINAAAVAYKESLPTYLRITDISEDGRYMNDDRVSVDKSGADSYFLDKGDIVFARTGASVGKTYLYNSEDGKLVFAGFLIRVKTDKTILDPRYLFYFTQTKEYQAWVLSNSMRSGQPGLNSNEFKSLELNLPDTEMQKEIIAVLSDMDHEVKGLEAQLNKYRQIKSGMMQNLLTGKIRLV